MTDDAPKTLRRWITENYDKDGKKVQSWKEFASDRGLNYMSVLAQVGRMKKRGLLPETVHEQSTRFKQSLAARRRKNTALPPPESGEADFLPPEASLSVLEGITNLPGSMPRAERLRNLSSIARTSTADVARIQAIAKLEEFERAAGTGYGPPPPTTKLDTVKLLVELLHSIQPEWVQEAIDEYQSSQESPQEEPIDPGNR